MASSETSQKRVTQLLIKYCWLKPLDIVLVVNPRVVQPEEQASFEFVNAMKNRVFTRVT